MFQYYFTNMFIFLYSINPDLLLSNLNVCLVFKTRIVKIGIIRSKELPMLFHTMLITTLNTKITAFYIFLYFKHTKKKLFSSLVETIQITILNNYKLLISDIQGYIKDDWRCTKKKLRYNFSRTRPSIPTINSGVNIILSFPGEILG